MIQEILALIIVFVALAYTVYKIYKLFHTSRNICNGCANSPCHEYCAKNCKRVLFCNIDSIANK